MKLIIRIILTIFITCNALAQANEEVWFEIEFTSVDPYSQFEGVGDSEYTIKYDVPQAGQSKCYTYDWGNSDYHETSGTLKVSNYTANSFTFHTEFFEDDCGDRCSYDIFCGASNLEFDEGYCQDFITINFASYESGRSHEIVMWLQNCRLQFFFKWYPKQFVYYDKFVSGNGSLFFCDFSNVSLADFSDAPSDPSFPLKLNDSLYTGNRVCTNTPLYIKTLGGSVDKNYQVFVEYRESPSGSWANVPGTPTFSDSIPLSLNQMRSGLLNRDIEIRIYRKSPGSPYPGNDFIPNNDNGYQEIDFLCLARKMREVHVLRYDITLVAPPPNLNLAAVELSSPLCFEGRDGSLNIQFPDLTSLVSVPIYQASIRDCSDTTICLDNPNVSEGNYGTRKFDNSSIVFPYVNLEAGFKILQVVNIQDRNLSGTFQTYGCPANYLINIPEKPPLEFTYSKKRYTRTDISCAGVWDGEVTVDIDGGTKPYRVTHDSSRTVQPWITLAVSDSVHTFTGMRADSTYHLAVTDFYDCPLNSRRYAYDSVRLISPDTLRFFELFADTFQTDRFNPGTRHVSCKGFDDGQVRVLLGSGRSDTLVNFPVNFWITGMTNTGSSITTAEMPSSVSNYSAWSYTNFPDFYAGKYRMHVRDNNGCLHSDSIKLYEPPQLKIVVTDSTDNLCFGDQKANFSVFANGGTRPFWFNKTEPANPLLVYRMCNDAVFTDGRCITNAQRIDNTEDSLIHISDLLNGTHTIQVRDNNNCIASVATTLSSPPQISVQLSDGRVTCRNDADGTLTPQVSGGVAPYTYEWKRNDTQFSTDANLSNLSPGTYSLDIKDANNCLSPIPASAQVRNPIALTATVDVQRVPSCADRKDAQLLVTPNGGWLEGNSVYQVSIDGVNWISEGLVISGLGAGTYTVYVKDGAGCQIEVPNVSIEAPNALTADFTGTDVSCHGGSNGNRTFTVFGGTAPYKVTWNAVQENLSGSNYSIGGLAAGNHTIVFEDSKGCLLNQSILILEPSALSLATNNFTDASPFSSDGNAQVLASGGVAPYSYSYSGGTGSSSPFDMINLEAGLHSITISDANFCVLQTEVPISNVGGPRVSTVTFTNPTCSYSNDGSINLSVTGNAPFTFDWKHGATDSVATNLEAGEYFVRIEDAIGLIAAQKIVLQAPEPLQLLMTGTPSLCYNECKGSIASEALGGNGGYSLTWSNGATGTNLNNLCADIYSATLTDIKGCSTSVSVELINPSELSVDLGSDITLCTGQQYQLAAFAGWNSYEWTFPNGTKSSNRNNIVSEAGEYTLMVKNENLCPAFDTIKVFVSDAALEANFLVSSRAYPDQISVLIDDTWPRPDRISWFAEKPDSSIVVRVEDYRLYVKFPYPGIYWFRLVAELGDCKDTVRSFVKVYERNDEEGYENFERIGTVFHTVNLYPNPANAHTTVKAELYDPAPCTITLFDSWGKVVRFMESESNDLHMAELDLSKLGQGVYLVQLMAGNEMKSIMLTIH